MSGTRFLSIGDSMTNRFSSAGGPGAKYYKSDKDLVGAAIATGGGKKAAPVTVALTGNQISSYSPSENQAPLTNTKAAYLVGSNMSSSSTTIGSSLLIAGHNNKHHDKDHHDKDKDHKNKDKKHHHHQDKKEKSIDNVIEMDNSNQEYMQNLGIQPLGASMSSSATGQAPWFDRYQISSMMTESNGSEDQQDIGRFLGIGRKKKPLPQTAATSYTPATAQQGGYPQAPAQQAQPVYNPPPQQPGYAPGYYPPPQQPGYAPAYGYAPRMNSDMAADAPPDQEDIGRFLGLGKKRAGKNHSILIVSNGHTDTIVIVVSGGKKTHNYSIPIRGKHQLKLRAGRLYTIGFLDRTGTTPIRSNLEFTGAAGTKHQLIVQAQRDNTPTAISEEMSADAQSEPQQSMIKWSLAGTVGGSSTASIGSSLPRPAHSFPFQTLVKDSLALVRTDVSKEFQISAVSPSNTVVKLNDKFTPIGAGMHDLVIEKAGKVVAKLRGALVVHVGSEYLLEQKGMDLVPTLVNENSAAQLALHAPTLKPVGNSLMIVHKSGRVDQAPIGSLMDVHADDYTLQSKSGTEYAIAPTRCHVYNSKNAEFRIAAIFSHPQDQSTKVMVVDDAQLAF